MKIIYDRVEGSLLNPAPVRSVRNSLHTVDRAAHAM